MSGPRLTLVFEAAEGIVDRPISVDGPELRVGRAAECELSLADSGASRFHAVLRHASGHLFVEDLGSANGTWVNGVMAGSGAQALRAGDVLRIGASLLVVSGEGPVKGPEQIPRLARRLLDELVPDEPPPRLSSAALEQLLLCGWLGNEAALARVILAAVACCRGRGGLELQPEDLPPLDADDA